MLSEFKRRQFTALCHPRTIVRSELSCLWERFIVPNATDTSSRLVKAMVSAADSHIRSDQCFSCFFRFWEHCSTALKMLKLVQISALMTLPHNIKCRPTYMLANVSANLTSMKGYFLYLFHVTW